MKSRDIKLKISNINLSLILLLLFTCCPVHAVKILRPGDTVKGKVITETFYCLSETENLELLNKVNSADLLKILSDKQEEKIEGLKDTIELLKLRIETKQDQKELTKELYDKSLKREKVLEGEVKIQEAEKNKERRRRKRSFWGGFTSGAALVGKLLGLF